MRGGRSGSGDHPPAGRGSAGTSFEAVTDDGEVVGIFEVDDDLRRWGSMMRMAGWADECNHWVRAYLQGLGVGTWLFRHGAAWLRLAGIDRFSST